MRVVQKSSDFQSSMESCRFESKKSFGDDKLLVEKVIERPRLAKQLVFWELIVINELSIDTRELIF